MFIKFLLKKVGKQFKNTLKKFFKVIYFEYKTLINFLISIRIKLTIANILKKNNEKLIEETK